MKVKELNISGCFVLQPEVYTDNRGSFFESFNKNEFKTKTGLNINFVQDNQSTSSKGALRGLHFQKENYAQAKLVRVITGKILDVAVDIRPHSSTYGKHLSLVLSKANKLQFFIPKGFAHGFLALEDNTIVSYKCDNYYNKGSEAGIRFDDPWLNIDWQYPYENLIISDKDKLLPFFKDFGK